MVRPPTVFVVLAVSLVIRGILYNESEQVSFADDFGGFVDDE